MMRLGETSEGGDYASPLRNLGCQGIDVSKGNPTILKYFLIARMREKYQRRIRENHKEWG